MILWVNNWDDLFRAWRKLAGSLLLLGIKVHNIGGLSDPLLSTTTTTTSSIMLISSVCGAACHLWGWDYVAGHNTDGNHRWWGSLHETLLLVVMVIIVMLWWTVVAATAT